MKWNRLNPGVPEKGERSSLFRVLARTPFNSCVRACCLFLPPCPAASGRGAFLSPGRVRGMQNPLRMSGRLLLACSSPLASRKTPRVHGSTRQYSAEVAGSGIRNRKRLVPKMHVTVPTHRPDPDTEHITHNLNRTELDA